MKLRVFAALMMVLLVVACTSIAPDAAPKPSVQEPAQEEENTQEEAAQDEAAQDAELDDLNEAMELMDSDLGDLDLDIGDFEDLDSLDSNELGLE